MLSRLALPSSPFPAAEAPKVTHRVNFGPLPPSSRRCWVGLFPAFSSAGALGCNLRPEETFGSIRILGTGPTGAAIVLVLDCLRDEVRPTAGAVPGRGAVLLNPPLPPSGDLAGVETLALLPFSAAAGAAGEEVGAALLPSAAPRPPHRLCGPSARLRASDALSTRPWLARESLKLSIWSRRARKARSLASSGSAVKRSMRSSAGTCTHVWIMWHSSGMNEHCSGTGTDFFPP